MPLPVLVIGSSNTDMVVRSDRLPKRGETVIGGTFMMNPGGKGANQAVAAARLGGEVTFVTKLGNDIFGKSTTRLLADERINTAFVYTDAEHPSGVALIGVDAEGENLIIVAPGANRYLSAGEVDSAFDSINGEAMVLLQLEIAPDTVAHVIREAHHRHLNVILNPAPAETIPPDLLSKLFLITPNESEAGLLTGIDVVDEASVVKAAGALHEMGVTNVMITLGKNGVYLSCESDKGFFRPPSTQAIDTTAAGDCFSGAVAVALSTGYSMAEAAQFGCDAASLSVTRMGAQASMPFLDEVKQIQKKRQNYAS